MHIRNLGPVPIVCARAGALAGGLVAARPPDVYASSATIRLGPGSAKTTTPRDFATDLRASLDKALAESGGAKSATLVQLLYNDPTHTTVKVTYTDRDPLRAQHVAETLTAAVARRKGATSADVVDVPRFPATPVRRDYPSYIVSGGGIGLVAGALVALRTRRRAVSAS